MKNLQNSSKYAIALIIIAAFGIIVIGVAICTAALNFNMNASDTGNTRDEQKQTFSDTYIGEFSIFIGNITIDMDLPKSPPDMRIYRGYFQEGDLVENISGSVRRIQNPVPVEQAPAVAEQILSQYGGLPSDAILQFNFIMYGEQYERTNHELIERIPEGNFVSWIRKIDGLDIEGDSDGIMVEMGENGTPTWVYKRWRTYESLGNVSIISAEQAIEKLKAGDVIDLNSGGIRQNVSVYNIHLSYYIDGLEEPEVILEPIWVFYGDASGIYAPVYVYARKSADWIDTSDTSPIKWNWNFGDGITSEERERE